MNRWALVVGGLCQNVVEQEGAPTVGGAWLNVVGLPVGPGWTWSGAVWSAPAASTAARHITQLAFLNRFTDAEAVAFDLASIGATQGAASLRRARAKLDAATFIDLDRADTRASVMSLESAGLIGAGRALEILDAAVQDIERPQR